MDVFLSHDAVFVKHDKVHKTAYDNSNKYKSCFIWKDLSNEIFVKSDQFCEAYEYNSVPITTRI